MFSTCLLVLSLAVLVGSLLGQGLLLVTMLRPRDVQANTSHSHLFWSAFIKVTETASIGTLFLLFSFTNTENHPVFAWLGVYACFAFVLSILQLFKVWRTAKNEIADSKPSTST